MAGRASSPCGDCIYGLRGRGAAWHIQTRGRDRLFVTALTFRQQLKNAGSYYVSLLGWRLRLFWLGCAAAAMVKSYNPEDPSFLSWQPIAPVQNWMGPGWGATIAKPACFNELQVGPRGSKLGLAISAIVLLIWPIWVGVCELTKAATCRVEKEVRTRRASLGTRRCMRERKRSVAPNRGWPV